MTPIYYVGYHQEESINKKSSSGGAFVALSDEWLLNHKAVVYGCILNEQLEAIHYRATDKQNRDLMCGSKYVSSNLIGIFKYIEEDIKNGFSVLFSGTPCQIAGLISYLNFKGLNQKKLLTVDVICHGVGSNRFFDDYIDNLENKYKSKAVSCKFRAKSKPGKKQDMEVHFDNGKKYNAASTNFDWFYSIYLKNLILRPSCYSCKFASLQRVSDISIGDYWAKDNKNKKDQSFIMVNSKKGKDYLDKIAKMMNLREIELEDVVQPHLYAPCKQPKEYNKFWNTYLEKGYLAVQKEIGNNTLKGKLKSILIAILDKIGLSRKIRNR